MELPVGDEFSKFSPKRGYNPEISWNKQSNRPMGVFLRKTLELFAEIRNFELILENIRK